MVIVTDCLYRSSIAAIHSFNRIGEEVICVTTDIAPNPPSFHSKLIKDKVILSSDESKYKVELISLCKKFEMPIIFPIGVFTLNVISKNLEEFASVANFAISDYKKLDLLNDKSEAKELAISVGIKTPALSDKNSTNFPLVVKPICGEKYGLKAKDRYKIVNNKEHLLDAIDKYSYSDVIIEEYVKGDGIGVSLLMGYNNTPYAAFCHKRLSEFPADGGPSTSLLTFKNDVLIQKSIKLLQSVNFVGIAMLEYKEVNDEFYFLEVNPRIWGSFGATDKANSNFAKAYIAASKAEVFDLSTSYVDNKKIKFIPGIYASVFAYFKKKQISKGIKTFFNALNPFVAIANFYLSDPLPILFDLFRKRR